MNHTIETHREPEGDGKRDTFYGFEFAEDKGSCMSCNKNGTHGVTLWRYGNGVSVRMCDSCAQVLAIALIRRT